MKVDKPYSGEQRRTDIIGCPSCGRSHRGVLGVVVGISERDGSLYFVCPETGDHVRLVGTDNRTSGGVVK